MQPRNVENNSKPPYPIPHQAFQGTEALLELSILHE